MDVGSNICMEPLHKRQDLLDACIDLLNAQWPRSKTARLYSLEKSCDGLPYSLVMVHSNGGKTSYPRPVIGYCRLAKVISVPSSVLIESVVVPETLRGRGLGRRVMELAEAHAKMQGFTTMYLSTKDKQDFYAHLGYRFCQAVNTLNAQMLETCDCSPAECNAPSPDEFASPKICSSGSEGQQVTRGLPTTSGPASLCPESGGVSSDRTSPHLPGAADGRLPTDPSGDHENSGIDLNAPPILPPPPPPPPLPPVQVSKTPLTVIYWMKKEIS